MSSSKKKDPAMTLTQRLSALDSKLEAKHAEVEAQAEETTRAVNGFKKCAAVSRTRMAFKAPLEEDLEEEAAPGEGVAVAE